MRCGERQRIKRSLETGGELALLLGGIPGECSRAMPDSEAAGEHLKEGCALQDGMGHARRTAQWTRTCGRPLSAEDLAVGVRCAVSADAGASSGGAREWCRPAFEKK
jgi:hypothetical protein